MKLRTMGALVALMIATSGCLSIKAYVDPQLPRVGYADLLARPAPKPVSLRVEFHRNGEPATQGASKAWCSPCCSTSRRESRSRSRPVTGRTRA